MDSTLDRSADAAPAAAPEHDEVAPVRPAPRADDSLARMADAVRRQNEQSGDGEVARPHTDQATAGGGADATTVEGNPLRAWDSVRPRQDDIGAWRAREGEWRWEDAKDRHAQPPEWSKPDFAPPKDGFRIPLDSALEYGLYRQDPDVARTIAPGVMAHVAAAISAGRLAATDEVGDLVPLMQRMTVDRELDVARGAESLHSRGAPAAVEPYAKPIYGMATYFQDGTANHEKFAGDNGGTNIAAMKELMRFAHDHDARIPEPHYFGGVGNEVEWQTPIRRMIGQGTGAGIGGILDRVDTAFRADMAAGISEFAAFGFSRGAAGTMESTNRFQDVGAELGQAYHLRHVGLFDTVAAIGPTGEGSGDLRLQPPRGDGKPDRIWHLISQDESRTKFAPVDVGVSGIDNVIKDISPAAHSDNGGSYANKSHSNIALHRGIEEARRSGVPMPSIEEVIATHPEEAAAFLPFLHQDHNAPRHYEAGWYTAQLIRDMPEDARPAEYRQKIIIEHRTEVPVRNPNHDFDRRSGPTNMIPEITVEHVDPDGRFVYSPHDTMNGEAPPRPAPRPSHRGDPEADRGIAVPIISEDGALRVIGPSDEHPARRVDEHDRRR